MLDKAEFEDKDSCSPIKVMKWSVICRSEEGNEEISLNSSPDESDITTRLNKGKQQFGSGKKKVGALPRTDRLSALTTASTAITGRSSVFDMFTEKSRASILSNIKNLPGNIAPSQP